MARDPLSFSSQNLWSGGVESLGVGRSSSLVREYRVCASESLPVDWRRRFSEDKPSLWCASPTARAGFPNSGEDLRTGALPAICTPPMRSESLFFARQETSAKSREVYTAHAASGCTERAAYREREHLDLHCPQVRST